MSLKLMNLKTTWLGLAAMLVSTVTLVHQASATLVPYFNQTAWEAAVDSITLVDFEGFVSDVNFGASEPDVIVGGLELSALSSASFEGKIEVAPGSEAINGNVVVDSGGTDNTDTVDIVLQTPVSAFSFLFENYDGDGDEPTLRIGPSGSETIISAFTGIDGGGFFGVVEDTGATFTNVDFLSTSNTNNGTFFSFDDVRYGTAAAVPEPSAFAFMGLVTALGMCVAGLRCKWSGGKELQAGNPE